MHQFSQFFSKHAIRFFPSLSDLKNLILINMPYLRPKDPRISLGMASIMANLKKHKISYLEKICPVTDQEINYKELVNFIKTHATPYTYTAFGAYVWNEEVIQKTLTLLKEHNYPGKIILGGPQINYQMNHLEKIYPHGDVFICGDAEEALVGFMHSNEFYPKIQGVNYKGQSSKTLAVLKGIDQLPSPFLGGLIQPHETFKFIRWETKRGCPFVCAYCKHNNGEPGKIIEFTKSRIDRELKWIVDNHVSDIAVIDPTFNVGKNYLDVLDGLISSNYSGKISFQCRLELCTPAFLSRIAILNKQAKATLEFGIQTIHKDEQRMINRLMNMKKVARQLDLVTNKYLIDAELSIIYGLPKQTLSSFQETLNFCHQYNVRTHAYPLMLLPGTALHEQKIALGLQESKQINHFGCQLGLPYVIGSQTFDYKDWQEMNQLSERLEEVQQPIMPSIKCKI